MLKLLTPSGHSPYNGPSNYVGNSRHGHKWMSFHKSIGKMVKATTIGRIMPTGTAALTITIQPVLHGMEDIIETTGMV